MAEIRDAIVVLTGAVLLLASSRALAVDGVVEINQAKVMAAGGFPYFVTEAGSYRLTSNLDVSGTTGIRIQAGPVTLDLNGYTVRQGGAPGDSTGIQLEAGAVHVFGGTVIGFFYGIYRDFTNNGPDGAVRIEKMHVMNNSSTGIRVYGGRAIIEDCFVSGNGDVGIYVLTGVITTNVVANNKNYGISASAATVSRNSVGDNFNYGIQATQQSLIVDNHITNSGIHGGCAVSGYSDTGYRDNFISSPSGCNATGATNLGGNYCSGGNNGACP